MTEATPDTHQSEPKREEETSNKDTTTTAEVKDETPAKPTKDYTPQLKEALEFKAEGNKLFNEGKFEEAEEKYTQAIDVMEGGHESYAQECSVFYGNRAACHSSRQNHEEVIKDCSESLKLVPTYAKALLRRAVAYEATNQLSKSLTGAF